MDKHMLHTKAQTHICTSSMDKAKKLISLFTQLKGSLEICLWVDMSLGGCKDLPLIVTLSV